MTLFNGSHDQKAELIKRAVEHREADRLIQQYGFFEPMDESEAEHYSRPDKDGDKTDWRVGDWAGCAIGCMASPVLTQDEYRKAFAEGEMFSLSYEDSVEILRDEFGIPHYLTTMAEFVFEALPKDEAKRWPEQFARALPVGADLGDGACVTFIDRDDNIWTASDSIRMQYEEGNSAEARDQLLAWLESLPTPAYGGSAA